MPSGSTMAHKRATSAWEARRPAVEGVVAEVAGEQQENLLLLNTTGRCAIGAAAAAAAAAVAAVEAIAAAVAASGGGGGRALTGRGPGARKVPSRR